MILWRHRDETDSGWVYYPTKTSAGLGMSKHMQRYKMNTKERGEYVDWAQLEKVDVWHPDSKQAMAKLLNKLENGSSIKWVR